MTKYIELETAINEFNYQSQFYDAEWGNKRFAPDDVEEIIRSIPTVDVAPVRHGKWIEEPNCFYRCSKCGEHYPSIKGYMSYHYCPNCGTKMDGDEDV